MVEAIDRIETYVGAMNKAGFVANTLVIDAVIRNIEVIGEASNKVRKHHRCVCRRTSGSSMARLL
ncbi:HepT-like ribonuclease domain-containing protein [Burkholderia ubonensis]|nr:HepT-like ribonuclease domain-containing protein [Burkholderia ubonensis]